MNVSGLKLKIGQENTPPSFKKKFNFESNWKKMETLTEILISVKIFWKNYLDLSCSSKKRN